jgi:hypothetical protein
MKAIVSVGILLAIASAVTAGPISKFDERPVIEEYSSRAKFEDVERCLDDLPGLGLAYVYRQPDRQDDVTLIWNPNMEVTSKRIDLHRTSAGTQVRSWLPAGRISGCAPR